MLWWMQHDQVDLSKTTIEIALDKLQAIFLEIPTSPGFLMLAAGASVV